MKIITTYCQCDLCLAIRKIQEKEASMQRLPLATDKDSTGAVVSKEELIEALAPLAVVVSREASPDVPTSPQGLLNEPL